jgi:uncharacterized protein
MARWQTALVTGASSGIGRETARQLAADGSDVVIVARREERLDALATELRADHGVDIEIITADLTHPEQRAEVEHRLSDVSPPVDLLVNNAGVATYGRFVEQGREAEQQQVELNVLAVVRLSHAAATAMAERGSGTIINVSSVAGFQPIPLNTTYSATKAFVTTFSEGLHEELRGTGVHVMALCPGFVRTEFQGEADLEESAIPGPAWLDIADVVRGALDGAEKGEVVCVPGLGYKAVAAASRYTPRGIVRRVVGEATKRM